MSAELPVHDTPRPPRGWFALGRLSEHGLHRRLLASFLLLALVPLFGSNAVGYLRSRRIVESQVEIYLHALSVLQAAHVAEHVEQRLAYLRAVAAGNRFLQAAAEREMPGADPTMRSIADPVAVANYLQRQIDEAEGRFSDMALYSLDGTLLGSPSARPRPFRRTGSASDPVMVLREDRSAPPILRYTAPVTNQSGEVVAYLSGSVSSSGAQAFVEFAGHLGGDIESLVLDAAGRPIFVSRPRAGLSFDDPIESPLIGMPAGSEGRYVSGEGVEVIATAVSMPGHPWTLLAEIPSDAALGELRSLRTLSIVLGIGFSVLVLAVGWFLASGIVAPVRALVSATRRVAAGDLHSRVPIGGRDEIGELSAAFNEMAKELAEKEVRINELHAQEIERAEQLATVGELAAGLAHEIKNPVVGIANGLDLVLRRVGSDPDLEPIGEEMTRQLRRIEQAVRDLLAFARPRVPRLARTDCNDLVRRVVMLVEPAALRAGVTLTHEEDLALPSLYLDADQIRQAVVNLAVNGVQHSRAGDRVRISTKGVDGNVVIAVDDSGSGMDAQVLQQLFKPFFTTRHSGTGLGLSITRGIIERHGGTVSVQSTPGEGSTFIITLPVASAPAGVEEHS